MNKTLSGRLQELKNEEKVQLSNPKSGHSCLRDSFFTKFNSQFKWGKGSHKLHCRAGHLRDMVTRTASTVFIIYM